MKTKTERTPQQALKDAIESGAVQAWINGKPIQIAPSEHPNKWSTLTHESPHFIGTELVWRPAPTPRLRPWKDGSEVPKLAIYRDDRWDKTEWSLILGASSVGIEISRHDHIASISLETALEKGEHSLDGGKTWAPCGVQEGGE